MFAVGVTLGVQASFHKPCVLSEKQGPFPSPPAILLIKGGVPRMPILHKPDNVLGAEPIQEGAPSLPPMSPASPISPGGALLLGEKGLASTCEEWKERKRKAIESFTRQNVATPSHWWRGGRAVMGMKVVPALCPDPQSAGPPRCTPRRIS